ncbi:MULTISPECIES: ribosomal protein S18-alanine N-acetyltransferase [Enterococcus]|uniref:ribosomal protein S18-alanine N-acetyltransferase n=1 Tax=Enterococcus TaxID=1350 RepID=UPI00065DF1F4|nr:MULTISPECIES: ribosomal protein S18-alanine N-acetyltransferase [Enterococcus]KAF1303831.1 ribosomal-protein-alanine N-acetyltransferase [Enterococcus sp. JM9B]
MNKLQIIKAQKEESEKWAASVYHLANEAYTYHSPWTQEQFLEDMKTPYNNYLLLKQEERLIGFLGYQHLLSEVEISNLVVSVREQGKGHGKKLLQHLIQQLGMTPATIFLEVRVSNHAAQNLYLTCGFEIISRRKEYYSAPVEDALVMRKKVRENE